MPPGIEAVSVMAAQYSATGGDVAVTDDGPSNSALPVPTLYPVSAVRLVPGKTTDWYVLATVKITRPGQFLVKGVAVTYRSDGTKGLSVYGDRCLRVEAAADLQGRTEKIRKKSTTG